VKCKVGYRSVQGEGMYCSLSCVWSLDCDKGMISQARE